MSFATTRKTLAQRAAIDARAAAQPRRLSGKQIDALARLCRAGRHGGRGFCRTVAGWHEPDNSVRAVSSQTIESLHKRGLVKRWRSLTRKSGGYWMVITAAGRREARRYGRPARRAPEIAR